MRTDEVFIMPVSSTTKDLSVEYCELEFDPRIRIYVECQQEKGQLYKN